MKKKTIITSTISIVLLLFTSLFINGTKVLADKQTDEKDLIALYKKYDCILHIDYEYLIQKLDFNSYF